MTIDEFKKTANELFVSNEEGCMKYLLDYLLQGSECHEELITLCGAYNRRKRTHIKGGLDSKEFFSESDKVFRHLSELISKIQETDLNHAAVFQKGIHEKILVVCSTENAVKNTQPLFSPDLFTQLTFKVHTDIREWKTELSSYRLLVFANFYDCSTEYEETLKNIVDANLHPVFYFGKTIDLPGKCPNEIYASNSKFSLYTRMKELLAYLDEYCKGQHSYPYSP